MLNPSSGSLLSADLAMQMIEVGVYTYIGKAAIGSLTSDAVWKIYRLDETHGLIVLWADGDNEFDNIWDDYNLLTYS